MGSDSCKVKQKVLPSNIFTLHGVWPGYSDGRQTQICNPGDEVIIKSDSSEIYQQMETIWMSYTGSNERFWSHEYNKHGYCYTKKYNLDDPKDFFIFAVDLFKKYELDQFMKKAFGDSISGEQSFDTNDLFSIFERVANTLNLKFNMDCGSKNSKQYLKEIRFYFDLDLVPFEPMNYKSDCYPSKPTFILFE